MPEPAPTAGRAAILLALFALAAAPEPDLDPANFGVRFLFHGGGAVTPEIATAFRQLSDAEGRVPLALLGGNTGDGEWWAAQGFTLVPPGEATAIWLHTGEGFALDDLNSETHDLLRAHLLHKGPLAVSGPGCQAFAGDAFIAASEVPLLPRTVLETGFLQDQREALRARVDALPAHVGYGLPEGTAMVVDGRQFRVLGAEALTVCLPTSGHRPGNFHLIQPAFPGDHLAHLRAARARVLEPAFPPPEFPALPLPAGTLVLVGGGPTPSGALRRFVEASGGRPILVVPTAKSDAPGWPDPTLELFQKFGAADVRALHARTVTEADSEAFAAAIDAAGGLWFGGGRQWRLVDRYADTRAHEAMRRLLARGGVIGGSSAGATICGDYLVRGNPLGPEQMMCEGYERGLAFLPGTAIDQHVTQRNRFADMEALKARYPQLLGIGLDEATALVVHGDALEVIGQGNVFIDNGNRDRGQTTFPRLTLTDGMRYSLTARALIEAEAGSASP